MGMNFKKQHNNKKEHIQKYFRIHRTNLQERVFRIWDVCTKGGMLRNTKENGHW